MGTEQSNFKAGEADKSLGMAVSYLSSVKSFCCSMLTKVAVRGPRWLHDHETVAEEPDLCYSGVWIR